MARWSPEPILLGRNEEKLRSLAEEHGIERWSTDLDETLADPEAEIYFDSQTTTRRTEALEAAIEAGKHVYCEKPTATSLDEALEIAQLARERGVKNGVVQDKLFLPGLLKLKRLVDGGFFGRILSVRGEFGYWVFDGDGRQAQRPSWNYREEEVGSSWTCSATGAMCSTTSSAKSGPSPAWAPRTCQSVGTRTASHTGRRPTTRPTPPSSSPAASWPTSTPRGACASTATSSSNCRSTARRAARLLGCGTARPSTGRTRRSRLESDLPDTNDYRSQWLGVPQDEDADNAFKIQWEMFLRHVLADESFPYDLLEGAKGVQLAELGLRSWKEALAGGAGVGVVTDATGGARSCMRRSCSPGPTAPSIPTCLSVSL